MWVTHAHADPTKPMGVGTHGCNCIAGRRILRRGPYTYGRGGCGCVGPRGTLHTLHPRHTRTQPAHSAREKLLQPILKSASKPDRKCQKYHLSSQNLKL